MAGVSAGYGSHRVLTDVTLDLSGPRTALLGANGSGKSTLLRVLSGGHVPSAGRVLVDDEPLRHDRTGLRAHRQRVQLLLQDPDDQLFSADVLRDVSFGPMNLDLPEAEVRSRVDEALAALSITHLADRPTHQLSYGERKRVALAGALAMRPAVLLLDEPTAGLDPEGVAEVLGVLDRLVGAGTSLVAATHDVELALAWADEVVVLTPEGPRHGDPVTVLDDSALLRRARLSRPWPLELAAALGASGGSLPRNLAEVVALLKSGPRTIEM
ncbi:energy-coupling factor ABC transporter ATP-binding protein [Granulicoccus sp. GXG6511]|uniref:energy-coupling factor ABC transporter ATP-binding protein n=1 Tax=Granulicoccus sp. GXG6511 TaxID=3381351 RepID=UPI003D7EEF18